MVRNCNACVLFGQALKTELRQFFVELINFFNVLISQKLLRDYKNVHFRFPFATYLILCTHTFIPLKSSWSIRAP